MATETDKAAYFDSIADRWDGFGDLAETRCRLEARVDLVAPGWASSIVDLGCGTGNLTRFILERAAHVRAVSAVDFSGRMLDVARRKIGDPRVRWLQEDAARTSIADGSADLVVCLSTWPHFPDPRAVLREVARVLRPGGRIVIYHVDSREAVNSVHRGVGAPIGGDILPPAADLAVLVSQAGFAVDGQSDSDAEYLVTGVRPGGE